jgi:hypothetical protein
MLSNMFGYKRGEAIKELRKLRNKDLNNLHFT